MGSQESFIAGGTEEVVSAFAPTRRQLLSTSSAWALVLSLGPVTACADPAPVGAGEPWDDGTFFDDGTGWVD